MNASDTLERATDRVDVAAFGALLAFVAALQISIAAAHILLTVTLGLWVGRLVRRHGSLEVPPFFWPLASYAAMTLVAAAFSRNPRASFIDSKQLVLFFIVPAVLGLARGRRAITVTNVLVTVGAMSAVFGIFQYGILEYDNLGRRPQGTMSHYMTYSGLLMLVTCLAAARLLFRREDRAWPALMMPALLVALALTFSRSAWVGACVGIGTLLLLKDLRLVALLPVLAALFIALAPPAITSRVYSMFDLQDPTIRDRVAMARAGLRMIRDNPLTGVGPEMVLDAYPDYRDVNAVEPSNPHLHNVPMQIAAERGLPALAIWIWFIVIASRDLARKIRSSPHAACAAGGLAAITAMIGAGLFEYNFGDSEFLMLFLVVITLPFAADRASGPAAHDGPALLRRYDDPAPSHVVGPASS